MGVRTYVDMSKELAVLKLIEFVRDRPKLWDINDAHFRNDLSVHLDSWNHIASQFNYPVERVMSVWQDIRKKYNEHCTCLQTCVPSPWPQYVLFFDQLTFLKAKKNEMAESELQSTSDQTTKLNQGSVIEPTLKQSHMLKSRESQRKMIENMRHTGAMQILSDCLPKARHRNVEKRIKVLGLQKRVIRKCIKYGLTLKSRAKAQEYKLDAMQRHNQHLQRKIKNIEDMLHPHPQSNGNMQKDCVQTSEETELVGNRVLDEAGLLD